MSYVALPKKDYSDWRREYDLITLHWESRICNLLAVEVEQFFVDKLLLTHIDV